MTVEPIVIALVVAAVLVAGAAVRPRPAARIVAPSAAPRPAAVGSARALFGDIGVGASIVRLRSRPVIRPGGGGELVRRRRPPGPVGHLAEPGARRVRSRRCGRPRRHRGDPPRDRTRATRRRRRVEHRSDVSRQPPPRDGLLGDRCLGDARWGVGGSPRSSSCCASPPRRRRRGAAVTQRGKRGCRRTS